MAANTPYLLRREVGSSTLAGFVAGLRSASSYTEYSVDNFCRHLAKCDVRVRAHCSVLLLTLLFLVCSVLLLTLLFS